MVVMERIEQNHLVITSSIIINSTSIETIALLDMGARKYTFVDEILAYYQNTQSQLLKKTWNLKVIDIKIMRVRNLF